MKAISNFHPEYNMTGKDWQYDFSELGTVIYEVDESEAYEEDEAKLLEKGDTYTLIQATGCSCWDGDWEGWTDLTLTELRKLGKTWASGYGAEMTMGKYIKENL